MFKPLDGCFVVHLKKDFTKILMLGCNVSVLVTLKTNLKTAMLLDYRQKIFL